jgi:alpha-glucuronidase
MEYDCWFQQRGGAEPAALLRSVGVLERGAVLEHAAAELRALLAKNFAIPSGAAAAGGEAGVLIGTIAGLGLAYPDVKPEGFVIQAGKDRIVIAGADEMGALYGVYRFLALLALGRIKTGCTLVDAPASRFRAITHWDNISGDVVRGYAGKSLFYNNGRFEYDEQRIVDYARLLASIGINRLAIGGVFGPGPGGLIITEAMLPDAARLAALFRPFGVRLMLNVLFSAPYTLGRLPSADPLDPQVRAWWKERADLIYRYIPDLAGFVVKADSEHEPGPFDYGRTHAQGANAIAAALEPHGGELVWRCFVYNCAQDWRDQSIDRARAAYDIFKPLDGAFAGNVLLQIKFGPYDFQVLEPVGPLFGALSKTRYTLELQITQEYTGQQIDLCYLPYQWERILGFDTRRGPRSTLRELLAAGAVSGVGAIPNVGLDRNWTGHTLAQANLYGYGRLCWNPRLSAEEIAREWSALTFADSAAAETVSALLMRSYPAYEKYNAPFGVCFMVTPGGHYGPNIEGYEFSSWGTYHRADRSAIGIDRSASGTGYAAQYAPENAALFGDPATCPEDLILFFHRLRYDYVMKNGKTLLQNIYDAHFKGYEEVQEMLAMWRSLKGRLDEHTYSSVLGRFEGQLANAREWRDQINTYFRRKTGIGDAQGRRIYE